MEYFIVSNMKKIINLLALSMVMISQGAMAQDTASPSDAKKWSLQECLDYALANNLQLKQNVITMLTNEQSERQAKAALLPSLSASTNQNGSWRPFSESFVNLSGGTMTTTSNEFNYNGSYGLNANWTVWNGGRNVKNVEKSKLTTAISELAAERTANSIQEQIAQYFVQILYQKEAVEVHKQVLEAAKIQRDRAQTMVEVGSLAKVDLKQLEAQVSQDEYNVVNARTQLENYKLQLKKILELYGVSEFDVVTPLVNDDDVLTPIPMVDDVFAAAREQRPEIKSGKLNLESAGLDIDIAKRGYYPTLSMSAGIGSSNSSGNNDAFFEQLKRNMNNTLGLTISVPIFDNRQNKTNVEKAKLSRQNYELQLLDAEKTLYQQIETYWLNAHNAQQQYLYAKTNVESMQESYHLLSEQFALGLKNIVELNTSKNNLLQAEQQLLQSKYTTLLNLALLRFYQGESIRL